MFQNNLHIAESSRGNIWEFTQMSSALYDITLRDVNQWQIYREKLQFTLELYFVSPSGQFGDCERTKKHENASMMVNGNANESAFDMNDLR